MKKRFTLMMMVLCFLMSIPLKMMAESVTVHFIDNNGWTEYDAYVFDISTNKSISEKDYPWPGKRTNYTTTTTANGTKVVTWTIDLLDCTLANARIIFNKRASGDGNQYPLSGGFEVANNQYYNNKGKTTAPSEGGGSTGSGTGSGSSTPVAWDTENTNRLTGKVYTQGFYLAGNFFSFSDPNKVTYDDAVFKFQQQKNKEIDGTDYEIYKVEIPASLDAHAQVMYVNEVGKITYVFGPGSGHDAEINKDNPVTDKETEWALLTANESTKLLDNTQNYWNFSTRNESTSEYSDGLYEVYIAVGKTSHEPEKWMITHKADKRVAYFISDAPDAIAMPLYDAYKKNATQFADKFFATVDLAANRSYYVISNYIYNKSYYCNI